MALAAATAVLLPDTPGSLTCHKAGVSNDFIANSAATSSWPARCYFGPPWGGAVSPISFAGFDERRSSQGYCLNPHEDASPSSPVLLQRRNSRLARCVPSPYPPIPTVLNQSLRTQGRKRFPHC